MAGSMSVCRTIIKKGNLYFVADRRDLYGAKWGPKFSNSPFDAKVFKDDNEAKEKAKKIGGYVVLFDAINGDLI